MEHGTRGVHISAGDGIVAHVGNLTAYASGNDERLNELLVRLNALANEPWGEIVQSLTRGISDAGADDHPALACVSVEEGKVAAFVFGAATLTVTIDGSRTVLDGTDSSTWIDVALRGTVETVHAGTQSASTVVGVLRDGVVPAGGFMLDTSGPIPAASRWDEALNEESTPEPTEQPAAVAAPPEAPVPDALEQEGQVAQAAQATETVAVPVAKPSTPEVAADFPAMPEDETGAAAEAPPEQVEAVEDIENSEETSDETSADSPAAQRSMFARIEEVGRVSRAAFAADELEQAQSPFADTAADDVAQSDSQVDANGWPQLKGVQCPAGHLTAPGEAQCRTCGGDVPHDAPSMTGPRPVLGVITFDDGAVLHVDRPAAVGADVPVGYVVNEEPATIVRLDDGVGGVSPVHLEVRLAGWGVEIVDMESETGTYTMLGGERTTRTKLRAGQQTLLQRDMEVQAGGRSFVYTIEETADA